MKKESKIAPCFDNVHIPRQDGQLETETVSQNRDMERFKGISIRISQALLAWIVLLIISPVLLAVFVPLLVWKYGIVWVIVKVFKRTKLIQGFSVSETVFAVDRFWENSRSSLGLVVELEGAIDVEKFREDFRKNVLEFSPVSSINSTTQIENHDQHSETLQEQSTPAELTSTTVDRVSESPYPKPFAKLTQIPVTFCGYYFWQKANYFLIHEHIRQINQPTDDLGLKKAASTLMTLPFPNRRPLWEILVYPNYLGTTTVGSGTVCGSALFIRFHRSLTDSNGLMNILQRMITDPSIKAVHEVALEEIKILDDPAVEGPSTPSETSSAVTQTDDKEPTAAAASSTDETGKNKADEPVIISVKDLGRLVFNKLTNLVFLPLKTLQFTYNLIYCPANATFSISENVEQLEATNASWVTLPLPLLKKVCFSQTPAVSTSSVEMSLFLEGVTGRSSHKCLNVPEKKEEGGDAPPENINKCQTCVLVQQKQSTEIKDCLEETKKYKLLSNSGAFVTIKCACLGSLPTSANKTSVLTSIHSQLNKDKKDSQRSQQVVNLFMGFLSLFPRHILRYLIMSKRWGAQCFIYDQFQFPCETKSTKLDRTDDQSIKLFGQYHISQIVPLVGLQWTYTLASAASLQCKDGTIIMSLIASSVILGPLSHCNPQEHAEMITKGFTEELDRLSDDAEDHGFVSIPIET